MEKIKFKDLEWYVLEKDKENIKLLLVNVLDKKHIKKYVDDEWYRDGHKVRQSSDVRANDNGWRDSYIRNVVLRNFKEDLGIDCKVTLLTKDEALNLNSKVKRCSNWYWTKTIIGDDRYLYFADVSGSGYSNINRASNSSGIRPVLYTKISNLALDGKNKVPDKLYKYMEKEEEGCYENILRVYDGGEYEINEDMSFVIDKINSIIDYLIKEKEINNEK